MADKKGKRTLVSAKYSKRSPLGEFWHRFRQNKLAVIGLAFLILLALECVFADVLFDYKTDVIGYTMKDRLQGPSAAHWFGTDDMGRDIFARVMYGARYSLLIAIATVALSLVVGVTLGAIASMLPGVKGLAFGTLTLALFVGLLPIIVFPHLTGLPYWCYSLMALISAVLLTMGFRKGKIK